MIPKNLKVGDTFKDGLGTFRVKEVVDTAQSIYISERIDLVKPQKATESTKQVKVEEIPTEEEKAVIEPSTQLDSFNNYTKTEINRLSKDELEKLSVKLGLPVSTGTEMKKTIIDHLGL